MTAPEYESVGWAVVESNGTIDAQASESAARAEASRLVSFNHECVAVELFRRREPVPERPFVPCHASSWARVTYEHDHFVWPGSEPHSGSFRTKTVCDVIKMCGWRFTDHDIRALLDLPAATAAWEDKWGGK